MPGKDIIFPGILFDLLKLYTLKKIKNSAFHFILILTILCLPVMMLSYSSNTAINRIQLSVDKSSVLSLKGTSNVNTFHCVCTENLPNYDIGIKKTKDRSSLFFFDARIKIPTKKLNCKNKAINHDLSKALNADEYPHITIEILEAYQLDACALSESCDEWTTISVDAIIGITDVCKSVNLTVQAMKLGPDRFRLVTSHTLSMLDFGIDPPNALMGLIKVNPHITIFADLTVEVLSSF